MWSPKRGLVMFEAGACIGACCCCTGACCCCVCWCCCACWVWYWFCKSNCCCWFLSWSITAALCSFCCWIERTESKTWLKAWSVLTSIPASPDACWFELFLGFWLVCLAECWAASMLAILACKARISEEAGLTVVVNCCIDGMVGAPSSTLMLLKASDKPPVIMVGLDKWVLMISLSNQMLL